MKEEVMKQKCLAVLFVVTMLSGALYGQYDFSEPLAHTFSIVARDPATGQLGVAVQSNWFSVGSIVSWAEPGVGAVATQSFVNASFGPRGLALLKEGKSAKEALQILLDSDEGREMRQVAIVDAKGNVAAHTGNRCIDEAGHMLGDQFSVQANMMTNNTVWGAMAGAFKKAKGPLAERMMAAMEAAQAEGGDIRGQQSAAILVVKGESTGKIWEDRLIDLRVEDHPNAVKEIKRTLRVYRAYEHMNAGDLAVEMNDIEGALREYGAAQEMFPDNLEMKYWTAVSLANVGRTEEALAIFKKVFTADDNWRELTRRLPKVGLLTVEKEAFDRIVKVR